jgi:RNA polymerase sigma factor (sigma-70 family)
MAIRPIDTVAHHLCAWVDAPSPASEPDRQLLERFVRHNDEAAFAALLRRHGPMVLHVCRRVLGRIHDAEDVFQATFLLLARKARAIRQRDSVGSFLHGVAYRLAVRAGEQARRRQTYERRAADRSRPAPSFEAAWRELRAVLDEELQRLPARYREVLVLCYLEGQTQEEAARRLGCPLGTVRSRVARARELLQERLARRGLALSGALLATTLVANAAPAAVPPALLRPTLKAALAFASGQAAGEGLSTPAVLIAEGGLQAMFAGRLKLVLTVALTATALAVGAGALALPGWVDRFVPGTQAGGPQPASNNPDKPKAAEDRSVRVRHGDETPPGVLRRLGSLRFRHDHGGTGWLATAFSRDGRMLATCAGSIRLWDPATGRLLREIDGRFWPCGSMLFSPGSAVLAVQGEKEISLLDPGTGAVLHRLRGEALSRVFAFSPDGRLLATSGPSSGARGGGRFEVSLWDTTTGRQVAVLSGHAHVVHSAAFTPDGQTLVTACYRNRVCRWDVVRGELRKSFDLPLREGRTACLSPDGSTLAIAPPWPAPHPGDTDSLWDTETGERRGTLASERGPSDYGLAFSPDGKTLATASTEAGGGRVAISLWKVETAERITRFQVPARAAFVLTFAPDGKTLLSSGPEPRVRLWDTATGEQLLGETGHEGAISSLSFTPDGRTLVSGADDGTLRVWDAAAGQPRRELTGHRGAVHAIAVAPDGKTVLSGGSDGRLLLHELDTGRERRRFVIEEQPGYQVLSLGLAADGRTAASWSATGMRERALFHVWDLATGEARVRRADPSGPGLRLFSPGAEQVLSCDATGDDGTGGMGSMMGAGGTAQPLGPSAVTLRDTATGRQLLPLPQPESHVYAQAFAPDGRTLVTATGTLRGFEAAPSDNHALHLWELATGKERLRIAPGHTGWEYRFEKAAFAPDGRTLATVRADQTVQLWDVATGAELLTRTGCRAPVRCLAFAPDSRVLASGHADSTILLWDLTTGRRPLRRPAEKPDALQLEHWWADLAGDDARKAHAAVWGFLSAPEHALPLLRDRLRPAPAVPAGIVRRLIADLDSNEFGRREAASAQLAALGEQVHAALQAALGANPPVEVRHRIEALLADPGLVRSAEVLRHLRALEVLERIGSPEARQVMEALARVAPEARPTREAKASLERLSGRQAAKP